MRFEKKNLAISVISIITTLIFIEITLQALSLISPRIDYILSRRQQNTIPDEKLGHRPSPLNPEHDQKGFRNKYVPNEVCVIAMGDSQTYGMGVPPNQAWVQQLEILGDIKTYNMAYGGYGPAHSLLLWEEAIDLKPKLIIEAFYAGNDLYDSYSLVYNSGQLSSLKSNDEKIVKAVTDTEVKRDTLPSEAEHGAFRAFFAEHSKLYGVLRAVKRAYPFRSIYNWERIKQEAMKDENCWVFEIGKIKTVFTPDYRLSALNLDNPRIAEGHRISLEAIRSMSEKAQISDVEFVVLLIPTKELVFKDAVYGTSAEIPNSYQSLIENEELFWQETKKFLREQGIHFIDALPTLRGLVQDGNQPYPISKDGHENSVGHRAVAELVLSEIEIDCEQ